MDRSRGGLRNEPVYEYCLAQEGTSAIGWEGGNPFVCMEPNMYRLRDEDVIYGLGRIAQLWSVSESTARRGLALPEAGCFGVGSMDNAGGGYGCAWYGQVNSLHALRELVVARTSKARRAAARARWGAKRTPDTAVSSPSL